MKPDRPSKLAHGYVAAYDGDSPARCVTCGTAIRRGRNDPCKCTTIAGIICSLVRSMVALGVPRYVCPECKRPTRGFDSERECEWCMRVIEHEAMIDELATLKERTR